jgi:site-specific DNA recombinase
MCHDIPTMMLVANADDQTLADPGLLRIIARAHDIHERLIQSTDLPLLAPDIVTAIVNGKNPPQLTAKKLTCLALKIPLHWTEQRKLLGFHDR